MEENSDLKKKNQPSTPANYVSILELRERWNKEQERKQKEKEERGLRQKQQQQQQRQEQWWQEEERVEQKAERDQKLKQKDGERVQSRKFGDRDSGQRNQKNFRRNYRRKESDDGAGASSAKAEVLVAVVSESSGKEVGGENLPEISGKEVGGEKLPEINGKMKGSRKKKKRRARAEKEAVGSQARAPSVETEEEKLPASREIRRELRPKRENGTEGKVDSPTGNAVADSMT